MKEVQETPQEVKALEAVDAFEAFLKEGAQVDCPIRGVFTPGMYVRECTLPAGAFVVSEMHKTEHPYVVSKGKLMVFTPEQGWILIEAPFTGVTKAGTKRVAYIIEETIWTTFHATDKTSAEDVEADIIDKRKEIEP